MSEWICSIAVETAVLSSNSNSVALEPLPAANCRWFLSKSVVISCLLVLFATAFPTVLCKKAEEAAAGEVWLVVFTCSFSIRSTSSIKRPMLHCRKYSARGRGFKGAALFASTSSHSTSMTDDEEEQYDTSWAMVVEEEAMGSAEWGAGSCREERCSRKRGIQGEEDGEEEVGDPAPEEAHVERYVRDASNTKELGEGEGNALLGGRRSGRTGGSCGTSTVKNHSSHSNAWCHEHANWKSVSRASSKAAGRTRKEEEQDEDPKEYKYEARSATTLCTSSSPVSRTSPSIYIYISIYLAVDWRIWNDNPIGLGTTEWVRLNNWWSVLCCSIWEVQGRPNLLYGNKEIFLQNSFFFFQFWPFREGNLLALFMEKSIQQNTQKKKDEVIAVIMQDKRFYSPYPTLVRFSFTRSLKSNERPTTPKEYVARSRYFHPPFFCFSVCACLHVFCFALLLFLLPTRTIFIIHPMTKVLTCCFRYIEATTEIHGNM